MSESIKRKLAAIMFTDIAGYTSQMSKDQDIALSMLDTKRKALQPLIQKHKGTLVKEMGDGTLSYFPSAIDATNCSLDLQKSLKNNNDLNIRIRIGVHLGDTSFRDDDVFGDGVNIASRLEKMSPPGGVLVSKNVYDELLSRKGYDGISLGLQSMKGVGRLLEVFGLKDEYLNVPTPSDYKDTKVNTHKDDEVPSIAIIPFENKGKKEDGFYTYGISADLISDCSSAGLIRVSSLSDIEKLDYTNLDNTELSKKLFVRYVSQGVLWKMDDMFQLSVELYDTKDKKVVWSDRWQEKWDNLASIKGSLSDGLLKALDTTPKAEKRKETTNPEAYEFYLKAKHKYDKRKNTNDTEIARGLLNKAIELDDTLIAAKVLLGTTCMQMGDYDEAMKIYTPALEQAEKLGNKAGMGAALNNIGLVHSNRGEYDKALEYYDRALKIQEDLGNKAGIGITLHSIGIVHYHKNDYDKALDYYARSLTIGEELGDKRGVGYSLGNIGLVHADIGEYDKALDYYDKSLKIKEEIGDKSGMGNNLNNIGVVHYDKKNDYDKALDYYARSLAIREELGDKRGVGYSLGNIGLVHSNKGDYDKALDYLARSLAIQEKLAHKRGMGYSLHSIGIVHYNRGEYNKAAENLEKSLAIQKEIGFKVIELETTTSLYLSYKYLNKNYDKKDIHTLIKDAENIEFEINFRLYQFLDDTSYLETAYKQVQDSASAMEDELGKKFLSYPIPKAAVEEYNKVFK